MRGHGHVENLAHTDFHHDEDVEELELGENAVATENRSAPARLSILLQELLQPLHDVGVPRVEVGGFAGIVIEVVKLPLWLTGGRLDGKWLGETP